MCFYVATVYLVKIRLSIPNVQDENEIQDTHFRVNSYIAILSFDAWKPGYKLKIALINLPIIL